MSVCIVNNNLYIVGVSITCIYCGQRVLYCGYMLWMYQLWITSIVGNEYMLWIYIVGNNYSFHILWMTYVVDNVPRGVAHNISRCYPQHIYLVGICCEVLPVLPM